VNNPTMEFIWVMRNDAGLHAACVRLFCEHPKIFRSGLSCSASRRENRASPARTSGESTSRRGPVTLDVVMGIIVLAIGTEVTPPYRRLSRCLATARKQRWRKRWKTLLRGFAPTIQIKVPETGRFGCGSRKTPDLDLLDEFEA
jgi:hypothetical protein